MASLRALLSKSDLLAFNLRNRDRWIAEQAAALPAGSRVIDVGAGSAPYRALFSHCDYRTQDFAQLDDSQIRHGAYGKIDYVGDATAIPVPDGTFDAVLCSEVLEHHPEPIALVRELGRILAPGGRLILTAPLGSGIHQEPYHFYGGYTPYWYRHFLNEAGFENIDVQANEGSFRHLGQETIRFVRMTVPGRLDLPWYGEVIWAPCWLLLAPILALAVPFAAKYLDRFDREQHFTVGYHVTATRARS
jgi:SAM-dependent methyltransferase